MKNFIRAVLAITWKDLAVEWRSRELVTAMLVFAILESCISFAGQELMTSSMDTAARQLRTGQVQPATVTVTSLKQMICKNMEIIVAKSTAEISQRILSETERLPGTAAGTPR